MKKIKLPKSYFNFISYLGTIVAVIAWISFLFLIGVDSLSSERNVYFGMFTYLIVPAFLILGIVLILLGMIIKKRFHKRNLNIQDANNLIVDLKNKKTRNSIIIFACIGVIFVLITIVSTFQGYKYTESVEFCGKLCHKVMNPEYTTYHNSPHAKIKCAECHIGEGVDWFVKSKISGMRQVFHYFGNSYPRPIETPIESLRPARETCEKCHWPQKFYAYKIHQEKYFLADSLNTEWNLILNMKTGSTHQSLGLNQGIHWHINPDIKIEYKADKKRENIYLVELTNLKTGKKTIYKDEENKISSDSLRKFESRTMDCMDCHNRPSHEFRSPAFYVDNLFASNKISSQIPWMKKISMDVLNVVYKSSDEASLQIKNKILNFYKDKNPLIYKKYERQILSAIEEIKGAYFNNAFPEMKITNKEYPRHIGHLETNGCFRCHNDNHKSADGKVISMDCNLCHNILGQGKRDSIKYNSFNKNADFVHPYDIGDAWKGSKCTDCHAEMFKQ